MVNLSFRLSKIMINSNKKKQRFAGPNSFEIRRRQFQKTKPAKLSLKKAEFVAFF